MIEWSLLISGGKQIFELAKSLGDISPKHRETVEKLHQLVSNLQSQIFEVRSQFQDLIDAKTDAEKKLVELEDWNKEQTKYELKDLGDHVFVYALKGAADGEASAWLCPKCFTNRQKGIMSRRARGRTDYHCVRCDYQVIPEAPRFPMIEGIRRPPRTLGI